MDHRKIHFVTCDVCDMSFDNALFLSNHCKSTHEKFEVSLCTCLGGLNKCLSPTKISRYKMIKL